MAKQPASYTFTVNGVERTVGEKKPLLRYLRDDLHIHSAKDGCSEGACGTCTVLVDDRAVKACVLTTELAAGRDIVTVEGLPAREQEAFVYAFGAVGAVQCGFCIPGMAMAGAGLVHHVPDPTEDQIKEAIKGNVCRCTGYKKIIEGIALAAAILRGDAEIDPELERGDRYGVGERAFRVDVRRKVLGYGKYPDDIDETDFPDLAYASAVRSKYPRARVVKIDADRARALPGVLAVLTAADVPVNAVGHLIYDWDVMIAEGDITRCVGDAIALVVAEDMATCERAKKLVKITYEELDPVRSIDEARAEGAPRLHDRFLAFGNWVELENNICQQRHVVRGDAATALAGAAHKVTRTFSTPFTEHAFLEPECAVAFPYKGGVKVCSTDQGAYDSRKEIAHMFGWDATPERVVVETMLVGGGFGGKEDVSVQHLAALAAIAVDRAGQVPHDAPGVHQLPSQAPRHGGHVHARLRRGRHLRRPRLRDQLRHRRVRVAVRPGARARLHALGRPVPLPEHRHPRIRLVHEQPAGRRVPRLRRVPERVRPRDAHQPAGRARSASRPWEIRYRNAIEPGEVLPNGQIADCSTALKETLLAVKDVYDAPSGPCRHRLRHEERRRGRRPARCGPLQDPRGGGAAPWCTRRPPTSARAATPSSCRTSPRRRGCRCRCIANGECSTENAPDSGTTSGSRQTLITGEAVRGAAFLLRDAMLAAEAGDESAARGLWSPTATASSWSTRTARPTRAPAPRCTTRRTRPPRWPSSRDASSPTSTSRRPTSWAPTSPTPRAMWHTATPRTSSSSTTRAA